MSNFDVNIAQKCMIHTTLITSMNTNIFNCPTSTITVTKGSFSPGLRAKHKKQHTGVGLLPCTWPGCKSKLSCPDALQQHIVTHTDQHFPMLKM